MIVRGAPAIGQVAAIAMAMSAENMRDSMPYARRATLRGGANALINARPTAINLRWAVDRMMARYESIGDLSDDGGAIADGMREEADAIVFEATTDHGRMAAFGLEVLPVPGRPAGQVLTHCNTGPLAAGQFGTALGVVQAAHHAERPIHVWVDETRPYLQGARLTTWELAQAGVPHALIADVAAGHLMARGEVDIVLVGPTGSRPTVTPRTRSGRTRWPCSRPATGSRSMSSRRPRRSTWPRPTGADIPIEERHPDEVTEFRGVRIAPAGTDVRNPAFDVTPAELITGFVTEEGVVRAPYAERSAAPRRSRRALAGPRCRASTRSRPRPDPTPPATAAAAD